MPLDRSTQPDIQIQPPILRRRRRPLVTLLRLVAEETPGLVDSIINRSIELDRFGLPAQDTPITRHGGPSVTRFNPNR